MTKCYYILLGQKLGNMTFLNICDYLPSYWELKFDYPDYEHFCAVEPVRMYDINKPALEAAIMEGTLLPFGKQP